MINIVCDGLKYICMDKLYEHDFGQSLQITGLTLTDPTVEAHFCIKGNDDSVLVMGALDGDVAVVPVPNSMLEDAGLINAYIYERNDTAGKTVYKFELRVERRADLPTATYDPTEEEVSYFTHVIEVITEQAEIVQTTKDELLAGLTIGDVETLPAGSAATADLVEDGGRIKLDLGIPQGEKGEKGEKGDTERLTVDTEISATSTNPVQNKVIKEYVDDAVSHVTIDVDDQMSMTSVNPVQNKVVTKHVSDMVTLMADTAMQYTDAVVQPKADKTYVDTTVQNAKLKNIKDGAGTGAVEEGCLSGNTVVSATGQYAHAEGMSTKAQGARSHAEGGGTTTSGEDSHAEGSGTKATATGAHAEGGGCTASGNYAHAEGSGTTASGASSHVEGAGSTASGAYAHAEGGGAHASGDLSHAEGISTKATAQGSHAEGNITEANGNFSHAGGLVTKANGFAQTVIGEYNLASGTADRHTGADDELFIIGNGEASARSNGHTVSKGGVGWYQTDVKVGGTGHTNATISLVDMNTALASKADKTYVDAEIDSVQEDLNNKAPVILESVSGSVVSFEDGAELPAESVIVHIEPQQDLHGYDNPYPAGGGKNKLDPSTASALGNTVWFCEPNGFLFKGGVSYTFSVSNSDDVSSIAIYSTNKSTQLAYSTGSTRQSVTYTPTEDTYGLPRLYRTTPITQDIVDGAMIEIGSARTTFAPYSNICPITGWTGATISHSGEDTTNPTTYSITFAIEAGTVYGGSLDVTNGVLTVDRAIYTFDGTENFNRVSNIQIESFNCFRWYSQTFMSKLPNWNTVNNAIMSCYSVTNQVDYWYSGGIGKDSVAWTIKNYPGLCIREDKCTTVDELKAILVGQTMVYLLTTPITYQLTPQEITFLLGENHIWSDTGNIDVEYRADTKAYIDNNNLGISDVQVNGTSVVSGGVAEIPVAGNDVLGVVKINSGRGVSIWQNELQTTPAKSAEMKRGWAMYPVITPNNQHESTFYGLAKASGDTTQSASSNAVGTYTETAKSKISDMLNGAVSVSGTTPTITALAGVRYVCGEVSTLDITPCVSGICDIVFTSGSTATVLTLPNTVKFPDGTFTPEANTTYEINILDGIYGAVMAWT